MLSPSDNASPTSRRAAYRLTDERHIDANRSGQLTAKQARVLRAIVWRRRLVHLVGGLLLLLLLSLFVAGFFVHFAAGGLGRATTVFVGCGSVGLAWWIRAQLLPFVREVRDLVDKRVLVADGYVRWRRRYVVAVPSLGARHLEYIRPVGTAFGTVEGPMPGPCSACFLAHSNIVVSVQPIAQVGFRSTADLAGTLRDATGTTAACLDRCRVGELPAAGGRRLLRMLGLRLLGVLGLALYLAADWSRLIGEPMWLGVVTVGLSFAALYLVSRARALWRDFRGGRVVHCHGVVRKIHKGATASALWPERFLTLAGDRARTLLVPAQTFAAVIVDLDYHLYFTPAAEVVVAIEPVDDSV